MKYQNEIIDPYVHPYPGAMNNDFILIDDNAQPHQATDVEDYLEESWF